MRRRARFEQALALYRSVGAVLGAAHKRPPDIAPNPEIRKSHLDAARAAWASIGREDLIATLDEKASG